MQSLNLFIMLFETVEYVFKLDGFLSMQFLVLLQYLLHLFNILGIFLDFLAKLVVSLLADLQVILLLLSSLSNILVEIADHLLNIHSHSIYILVLNLDLFRNSLSERSNILKNLAAFLHSYI